MLTLEAAKHKQLTADEFDPVFLNVFHFNFIRQVSIRRTLNAGEQRRPHYLSAISEQRCSDVNRSEPNRGNQTVVPPALLYSELHQY